MLNTPRAGCYPSCFEKCSIDFCRGHSHWRSRNPTPCLGVAHERRISARAMTRALIAAASMPGSYADHALSASGASHS